MNSNAMAQESTYLYEIRLYEKYRHKSFWTEREEAIQKRHVNYLESLTNAGKIQFAGIVNESLEEQTGFILLSVSSYEEAFQIASADPSVKEGMMSLTIQPINIYFDKHGNN